MRARSLPPQPQPQPPTGTYTTVDISQSLTAGGKGIKGASHCVYKTDFRTCQQT